jgi:hypothetical protein
MDNFIGITLGLRIPFGCKALPPVTFRLGYKNDRGQVISFGDPFTIKFLIKPISHLSLPN